MPRLRNTFPLMGLAAILIANSHLESLYPKRWMAADGLLGNTIFFLLAGYGILISQRQRPAAFATFYWKRFIRIYPSYWIAMLIAAASGMMVNYGSDLTAWFSAWAWPTSYGFIGNIMVFYPVLWLLARTTDRVLAIFILVLGLIWLGIWLTLVTNPSGQNLTLGQLPLSLWWINSGLSTALGAYIARKPLPTTAAPVRWALIAAAFAIYLILKFELALRHFTTPEKLSSILLAGPILLLATACAALLLLNLNSLNNLLCLLSPVSRPLSPVLRSPSSILTWIGQASLQIYVLHMIVYHWVHLTNLPWPIQLILFAIGTMIASRALLSLTNRIGNR